MPSQKTASRRLHPLRSLVVRSIAMVAISVLLVLAVTEVRNSWKLTSKTEESLRIRGTETVSLLAAQIGGDVQFGNTARLEQVLGNFTASAGEAALGSRVFNAQGNVIASTPGTRPT